MGTSILNIGISALNAAQVGVATTGHNISNASTPGYSRQIVQQSAVVAQNIGFAFVGQGTEVSAVNRVYSQFLTNQVLSAQTASSQLTSYSAQIKQMDDVLADSSAGVSPALQDFFASVQTLTTDTTSTASRQALLSSSAELVERFQGLSSQLSEQRQGINGEISASVDKINSYATQIAKLNSAITNAQAIGPGAANDLLDQRDEAIANLSKETAVTVVKQDDNYNVFIGKGQPIVVGNKATTLIPTISLTDSSRMEISAQTANGAVIQLEETSLTGGNLGGLFEARSSTLDVAQNSLGRIATVLGTAFNTQHELGQTQTGANGGVFFNVAVPLVNVNSRNTGTGVVTASITNSSALTISDYQLQNISTTATPSYNLTRLSDGKITNFSPAASPATSTTVTLDGVAFTISGAPGPNDQFVIRPVFNGASGLSVAIINPADIALGSGTLSSATASNVGSGTISAVTVSASTLIPAGLSLTYAGTTLAGIPANLPVTVTSTASPPVIRNYAAGAAVTYNGGETVAFGGVSAVFGTVSTPPASNLTLPAPNATLTYSSAGATLSGFPSSLTVSVTTTNGNTTSYAPGTAVPFTAGASVSFGGISIVLGGSPANGDTFTITPSLNARGDNQNALALAKLQIGNIFDGGTTTFQGAYSQLVNTVGSKAGELDATGAAASSLLEQAINAQQSVSGVNLDEEAANLLKYQQAYQAAGKLIQAASTLFATLLSLGAG